MFMVLPSQTSKVANDFVSGCLVVQPISTGNDFNEYSQLKMDSPY